jgi:16S rRNA (uracil1498-N3)-methyltransferase
VERPQPAQLVSPLRATVIQAIGKGDKAEQIVRDTTALGAARLLVVESQRSVVRLGGRAALRRARWRIVAVESARQCGRGDLPAIEGPIALSEALQACRTEPGLRLCFDPDAPASLARALAAWTPEQPVTLLVGPEGGLAPEELSLAREAGFFPVSLGPFTLRTETVATAALAILLHRLPG